MPPSRKISCQEVYMGAGSPKTPDGKNPGVNRRSSIVDLVGKRKQDGGDLFEISSSVPPPQPPSAAKMSLIRENVEKLKLEYPMSPSGYFGEKGKNARVIISDDPHGTFNKFAGTLTAGMAREPVNDTGGWISIADDGTIITCRPVTSTPNSPAILINTKNAENPILKGQKIHFDKKVRNKK
jgi:hypothetical protein